MSEEDDKLCSECVHLTAYDDGDGRWDYKCEITKEWNDGWTWTNKDMKNLEYANKCPDYKEES